MKISDVCCRALQHKWGLIRLQTTLTINSGGTATNGADEHRFQALILIKQTKGSVLYRSGF